MAFSKDSNYLMAQYCDTNENEIFDFFDNGVKPLIWDIEQA